MEELDRMEDMFVIPGGENMSSVKFSDTVTIILERLYSSGMTGWGKDHNESIETAIATTGLTESQVKVGAVPRLEMSGVY